MMDVYIVCDDLSELSDFLSAYKNIIGPRSGQEAVEETTDDDGNVIAAKPAVGDPTKYYACVRSDQTPVLSGNIDNADEQIGKKLLGVWV